MLPSFELYDRARTLERHEKQFFEVAVSARKSIGSVDKQKETVHSRTVSRMARNSLKLLIEPTMLLFIGDIRKLWFIISSVRRLGIMLEIVPPVVIK